MKATELRIGNYAELTMAGSAVFPKEIRPVKASEFYALSNHPEWADPVPLTEEWLLKFGFTSESIYSNYIFNNIEINSSLRIIATNERRCFWLDGDIPPTWKISLNHVHQLQNLYFALTGEELTIQS